MMAPGPQGHSATIGGVNKAASRVFLRLTKKELRRVETGSEFVRDDWVKAVREADEDFARKGDRAAALRAPGPHPGENLFRGLHLAAAAAEEDLRPAARGAHGTGSRP